MIKTVVIADKQTLDEVKNDIGSSNDTGATQTTGTVMGKLNAAIENASSAKIQIDDLRNILYGKTSPYGLGTQGDVVYGTSKLIWGKDAFDRYILHVKSLVIPADQTMTPPDKHMGLYIFCQGDITINGTLSAGKRAINFNNTLTDTITIEGVEYALAKGGNTVNGGNGGNGGKAKIGYATNGTWANGGTGAEITTVQKTYKGDISGGGTSNYGAGGEGGYSGSGVSNGAAGQVIMNTESTGAICIVCGGTITINGLIDAKAIAGINAQDGFIGDYGLRKDSDGDTFPYVNGGIGGNGAVAPSGGGCVTLIGQTININGKIMANGEKLVSPDGVTGELIDQVYVEANTSGGSDYVDAYGGEGGKGGTFISTAGEIKCYEIA